MRCCWPYMSASRVLVTLLFVALAPAIHAKQPVGSHSPKGAAEKCSNSALKEALTSTQPSAIGLEQLLGCLGRNADRLMATNAAYEIALNLAGAAGDRPADFRKAAQWARKSADYLKTANDPKLRNATTLAAIRLEYYAASTTAELRQVAQLLDRYSTTACSTQPPETHCAESLKLLGEVERDLSGYGLPRAQAAVDAFRRYLDVDAGKKPGLDRASALLDKGTLIAQAPAGALTPDERRVIAKAEWTRGEENPRFIVTTLTEGDGRYLYEDIYCARGEMENRIKECQIDLFADRTSTATMAANQLRLWFASMAYVLTEGTRRLALEATDLADATCGTIRRKLFKIGALVTISVRRIKFAMASGCPYKAVLATAHRALDST